MRGCGKITLAGKGRTTMKTKTNHEVVYSTRHLSRALHSRLHIIKAARNARGALGVRWTLDDVLNEALAIGVGELERRLK